MVPPWVASVVPPWAASVAVQMAWEAAPWEA